MNFENLYEYDFVSYTIVSHVLTLGYAAMAAGLVYFLVSSRELRGRYRLTSFLSAVVMISAFFELAMMSIQWERTFVSEDGVFVVGDTLFSNGFRYMNWSIDVPVLLVQLLIVMGVTGVAFRRGWVLFVIGGLGMIYTGYAGQFYEVERSAPFWVWGAISTVFFFGLLVLVYRTIYGNLSRLPREVHGMAKSVWWLLLVSWMLYPGAYLMPAFWDGPEGVVARQITYTVADITSKVIYGVLLGVIARTLSRLEGYQEAVDASVSLPRGGITDVAAPGRI